MFLTLCDRQYQNFIPRIRIITWLWFTWNLFSSPLFLNLTLKISQVAFKGSRCLLQWILREWQIFLKVPWMSLMITRETWQPWFRNFPVPRVHPGCSSWFSVLERLHFNRMLWSPCSRRVNSSSLYLSYLGYHWETLATVSIKTVILIKNIIHIFIRSIKKMLQYFFLLLSLFFI